jgi:hypothetical protein
LKYNKYQFSILAICEKLHMSQSGAGDRLTKEETLDLKTWLNERLIDWHDTPQSALYDNVVRTLIIATIQERELE